MGDFVEELDKLGVNRCVNCGFTFDEDICPECGTHKNTKWQDIAGYGVGLSDNRPD